MTTSTAPIGKASQAVAGQDLPADITDFLIEFYRLADTADHDAYLGKVEPDVKFTVYSELNGHDEIREARKKGRLMRKNVKHTLHHAMLVEPNVVFATGIIDYDLIESGAEIRGLPWVGRVKFNGKEGEDRKVKDYYVWVVSREYRCVLTEERAKVIFFGLV